MVYVGANVAKTQEGMELNDGGCCIIKDGQIIAIAEERVTQKKYDGGFSKSLKYCLDAAEVEFDEISKFVVSSCCEKKIKDIEIENVVSSKIITCPSHHLSHALGAYMTSQFDEAIVMVIDNEGNILEEDQEEDLPFHKRMMEHMSFYIANKTGVNLLERDDVPIEAIGVGDAYRYFTHYLGFPSYCYAGKTMGLAAYGNRERFKNIKLLELGDGVIKCNIPNDYKYNRKKISIFVYILSAILVISFTLINTSNLIIAFVVIFILQGTSDVDNMAQDAMLPEVISKDDLATANTVFHYIGIVVGLIGPGLGGILYSYFGGNLLYIIDAITFVFAALIMTIVPYKYQKENIECEKFTLFALAKEGIVEIKKHKFIQALMVVNIFLGILGRFYEIDKVYLADNTLNVGVEGIVYFSYAMSIGTFLAPLLLKVFKNREDASIKELIILSMLTVSGFIMWGNTKNLIICLIGNFMIGLFGSGRNLYSNVIFQRNVDRNCMGRVMAFNKICIVGSSVIGIILAPILLDIIGVGGSVMSVGFIALACMVIAIFLERNIE